MANKDDYDYLTEYREFFENFAQTVNPNDQLPVRLASYKLFNLEVIGAVVDWTSQYLYQKKCPPTLIAPLVKIIIEEVRKMCKKNCVDCGFRPSENVYEPLRLMQTVMAKTNEVCLRYLDNSVLCTLPMPEYHCNVVSTYCIKNKRRKMEDRHVVVHDLNTTFNLQETSPSSYFAVFDGHAGPEAAAYSAAHLHQYLVESQHFQSDPSQALKDAFYKTDSMFVDKCNLEHFNSGTTAVCALLRPKERSLYIAWTGDSQAVLTCGGQVVQCVEPHKPSREDEKERIESSGGVVLYSGTWRVNGWLAVSRAIGDPEHKPYVIAIPDVKEITLNGTEDFLIIACDGLWDFLPEEQAARLVYNIVCNNPEEASSVGERLAQSAIEGDSSDNISVIVVFLRDPKKIAADAQLYWANRNGMETGLDNSNNPFLNSNGSQKDTGGGGQGFLLDLNNDADDELKPTPTINETKQQNGTSQLDFFGSVEKDTVNFHRFDNDEDDDDDDDDDDLGPETDVDAVDDVLLSPSIAAAKALADEIANNNPVVDNPFGGFAPEKSHLEDDLQDKKSDDLPHREETPTPPADAVHDAGGLIDNVGDSGEESEDEWNYIKGDNKDNKENVDPTLVDSTVTEPSESDTMSQLNPDAAEFVPVSPIRSVTSPELLSDQVISQSPRRFPGYNANIAAVLDQTEFEREIRSRPSDIEESTKTTGDATLVTITGDEHKTVSQELMENLLNGKSVEEIEFQPNNNTPRKEEFHFGPNAAPFTPGKPLDQSEALSTKALFGDETLDNLDVSAGLVCETNQMSMSFHQDREEETNPFDLNKVHDVPENLEEFLKDSEKTTDLDAEQVNTTTAVEELKVDTDLLGVEKLAESDSSSFEHVASPTRFEEQNLEEDLMKELSKEEKSEVIEKILEPETDVCRRGDVKSDEEAKVECGDEKSGEEEEKEQKDVDDLVEFMNQPIEPQQQREIKVSDNLLSPLVTPEPTTVSPVPPVASISPEPQIPETPLEPTPIESQPLIEQTPEIKHEPIESEPITPPVATTELESHVRKEEDNFKNEDLDHSTPKSIEDTVSIATTDVRSFLERSDVPEVESPMSEMNVELKTEVIEREYPVEELVSVSEDSAVKTPVETERVPSVEAEVVVAEKLVDVEPAAVKEIEKTNEAEKDVIEETVGAAAVVAAATAAAVAVGDAKKPPKKTVGTATKKPLTKTTKPTTTTTTKPPTATKSPAPKTTVMSPKPSATAPKAAPAATKATTAKAPTTRPRTLLAADKKPLTNGDAAKSTTGTNKSARSPTRKVSAAREVKPALKASPTAKAAVDVKARTSSRLSTVQSATTVKKDASVGVNRPSVKGFNLSGVTTNKTTSGRTSSSAASSAPSGGTAATKTAPKRPSTAPAAPLRRVPLTKTTTVKNSPDVEKQVKDNLNKLAASRAKSATQSSSAASIGVKKPETKPLVRVTTTTKTSTTVLKATKKPESLVRKKQVKAPPPAQQNGISVVEEITVTSKIETDQQLVKDNSPVDKNLITDGLRSLVSNKAD